VTRHPLDFELGWHREPDAAPEMWIPAQVPGAVQLDWARAQGWPAWWFGDEWRRYRWMEDVHWTYRARFDAPAIGSGESFQLWLGGIDHSAEVFLNDAKIADHTGMQTPLAIGLTGLRPRGNELRVRLRPAPKSQPSPESRVQANATTKPAVSYTWDFHPRLIPLGLWRAAELRVLPAARIVRAELFSELAPDLALAHLRLAVDVAGTGTLRWRVLDPAGREIAHAKARADSAAHTLGATIQQPALWWPHDQGTPALHRWEIELVGADGAVLDRAGGRFGIRRAALVMHEGAWQGFDRCPMPREHAPITLEVNGRALFAKGTNFVSPEVFPATITDETYRTQLTLARDAGFSLVRIWGGAPAPRDALFDLCDELGLMVWQEFPLACNRYPDTPEYLAELEQEARSLITRLRPHPSLVLWCGGNELFNHWSGMTDQAPALRLLASLCWQLDPARPFLPTAPFGNMAHGPYSFREHVGGWEIWSVFQDRAHTAYTEFGCTAPTHADTARRVLPPGELWPPRHDTAWDAHTGYTPGDFGHLNTATLEAYLGPVGSPEEYEQKGQLLQFEGVRGLYEEARRQKPRAAMALTWCFNEPWPTLANCALVAWPSRPKRGYDGAKLACRPALASARIRKFAWTAGEIFDPELWILNDAPRDVAGGTLVATLIVADARTILGRWDFPRVDANKNLAGPRLALALPDAPRGLFQLELTVYDQPELASAYTLCFNPHDPAMLDVRGRR
jgi:beta-mannosidase